MRSRPSTVIASLAVAVTLLSAGVANAAWSKAGTGSGATSATSLVTPELTAVRSTTSPSTAIVLSWTDGGQLAGTSYEVRRDGALIGCSSSPCTDSGVTADTTYSYVVTAKLGQWTKASAAASASTASAATPATKLVVSAPTNVTAGVAFTVTLTAARSDNTTDTAYVGDQSVQWTGNAFDASPSGAAATPASGSTTIVSFTGGVGTTSVTLTKKGLRTITASQGVLTGSTDVTVAPAAPSRLAMTSTTVTGGNGTAVVQCLFGCSPAGLGLTRSITTKVSVTDSYGNIVTLSSAITVTLSGTQGTPSPTTLTIPASAEATSNSSVTWSVANENANNTALTAASQSPATYTSVTATIKK